MRITAVQEGALVEALVHEIRGVARVLCGPATERSLIRKGLVEKVENPGPGMGPRLYLTGHGRLVAILYRERAIRMLRERLML
ncbi:hypothetical protein WEB32_29805 [Streptomyces netropsis]|uniref:hypothetical protein n=1 Tax=Streptomyces netropsis TaxID=55404 RepID=UPI0030CCDE70